MTSALVGTRPLALAADDATGSTVRSADAEAGAVPESAGFEAAPGTAEPRASSLFGARVLLAVDEIVGTGTGLALCTVQPEATASAAMAAHRVRRADRCRGRRDRIRLFTIVSFGRALAPLCHRDMARQEGESADVSLRRLRCSARGGGAMINRVIVAAG